LEDLYYDKIFSLLEKNSEILPLIAHYLISQNTVDSYLLSLIVAALWKKQPYFVKQMSDHLSDFKFLNEPVVYRFEESQFMRINQERGILLLCLNQKSSHFNKSLPLEIIFSPSQLKIKEIDLPMPQGFGKNKSDIFIHNLKLEPQEKTISYHGYYGTFSWQLKKKGWVLISQEKRGRAPGEKEVLDSHKVMGTWKRKEDPILDLVSHGLYNQTLVFQRVKDQIVLEIHHTWKNIPDN